MVAYAVALCITMPSASIALVMQDIVALVFNKKEVQLPTSSQLEEIIENLNIVLCFLKIVSPPQG